MPCLVIRAALDQRADVMLAGVYRSLNQAADLLLNAEATGAFTGSGRSLQALGPPWAGWRARGPLVFPHTGDYATRLEAQGSRR